MNYISNSRPPLPDWILTVYDLIRVEVVNSSKPNDNESISWDQAIDILDKNDDLVLELEDASYALTRLVDRGYFYKVDDVIHITDIEISFGYIHQ